MKLIVIRLYPVADVLKPSNFLMTEPPLIRIASIRINLVHKLPHLSYEPFFSHCQTRITLSSKHDLFDPLSLSKSGKALLG